MDTYPYSGLAATDSVGAYISKENMSVFAQRCPEVFFEVSRKLDEKQDQLILRLADLPYESVRARLVRVLLELGEEHGVAEEGRLRIDVPLSLSDLAEMIGATRQATSKELQVLRGKGLIEVAWPWIFLSNSEGLYHTIDVLHVERPYSELSHVQNDR